MADSGLRASDLTTYSALIKQPALWSSYRKLISRIMLAANLLPTEWAGSSPPSSTLTHLNWFLMKCTSLTQSVWFCLSKPRCLGSWETCPAFAAGVGPWSPCFTQSSTVRSPQKGWKRNDIPPCQFLRFTLSPNEEDSCYFCIRWKMPKSMLLTLYVLYVSKKELSQALDGISENICCIKPLKVSTLNTQT